MSLSVLLGAPHTASSPTPRVTRLDFMQYNVFDSFIIHPLHVVLWKLVYKHFFVKVVRWELMLI